MGGESVSSHFLDKIDQPKVYPLSAAPASQRLVKGDQGGQAGRISDLTQRPQRRRETRQENTGRRHTVDSRVAKGKNKSRKHEN